MNKITAIHISAVGKKYYYITVTRFNGNDKQYRVSPESIAVYALELMAGRGDIEVKYVSLQIFPTMIFVPSKG